MFKNKSFILVFVGTAIGMFPLFVAPFFLPLYSTSLGLPSITGSLLLGEKPTLPNLQDGT